MEIADYLRVARRRMWVLLGVPLLAAAITSMIVMAGPTTYTATSTVAAPALIGGSTSNQYTGAQAVSQFVAQFEATAHVPAVVGAVSRQTKVAMTDITDGLTITQVGASSVMQMAFTSSDHKVVQPVLQGLTKQTLQTMFGTQVQLAQGQVATASTNLAQANAAIVAWEKAHGMVDPTQVYQSTLQRLNSLTQQWATQSANGSATGAAALSGAIASVKAQLPAFGPYLAQYQQLTSSRDAAATALSGSQQALAQAKAQLAAADPSRVASISTTVPVSRTSSLVSLVLPVTGAAIFLAIALVAMLELISRARPARLQASQTSGQSWTQQERLDEPEPAGAAPHTAVSG
ncbi:hypothetical protein [Oryzihumus sp.]|uniref:hypothetical protein n=1 Tax=Oryzihumus sp. TaxID=1968903 RepID=UPI002EDB93D1